MGAQRVFEEWRDVGPGTFSSKSSRLLLQLWDAFECQQLAKEQNVSGKTNIKRIGGREEGLYLISAPFIFNNMQLLCSLFDHQESRLTVTHWNAQTSPGMCARITNTFRIVFDIHRISALCNLSL